MKPKINNPVPQNAVKTLKVRGNGYYKDCWNRYTPKPAIIISGRQLEKFGFFLNSNVVVTITHKKIEITC